MEEAERKGGDLCHPPHPLLRLQEPAALLGALGKRLLFGGRCQAVPSPLERVPERESGNKRARERAMAELVTVVQSTRPVRIAVATSGSAVVTSTLS